MTRIQPVILAGVRVRVSGLLRDRRTLKQLLPMVGDMTMLQDTLLRLDGMADVSEEALVVRSEAHRFRRRLSGKVADRQLGRGVISAKARTPRRALDRSQRYGAGYSR